MVHLRLNEKETNPNPHVNFISALPTTDNAATEDARQLLRALAAQVRPVMKSHGFTVNSFEEYEHNQVFSGRNWNNGETIELVLRSSHGYFLPKSWLMSTLCHELAHIKHMNHGPAFQALWARLRAEVRELQAKGYYGDGYWSSGTRLIDSARVGAQDVVEGDLPEYMCGGALSRARPTRRRRLTTQGTTGRQTQRKRKAGTRVTSKAAFAGAGDGTTVGDAVKGEKGAGFGKRTQSKKAREERAAAAERRLSALAAASGSKTKEEEDEQEPSEGGDADGDDDDVVEVVPETDQDRRRVLLESMSSDDADGLRSGKWRQSFMDDFLLPSAGPSTLPDDLDTVTLRTPLAAAASGSVSSKRRASSPSPETTSKRRKDNESSLSYGKLVQDEVVYRRKEALGMVGTGRTLGASGSSRKTNDSGSAGVGPVGVSVGEMKGEGTRSRLLDLHPPTPSDSARSGGPHRGDGVQTWTQTTGAEDRGDGTASVPDTGARRRPTEDTRNEAEDTHEWACLVCTLMNAPGHLACSACATPRGDTSWSGDSQ